MKNNIFLKSIANILLAFSMLIFSNGVFASELIKYQEVNHNFTYISGEKVMDLAGPVLYEEGNYIYYRSHVEPGDIFRYTKDETTPIIKVLDGNDYGLSFYEIDGDYIYYKDYSYDYVNNIYNNGELYRIKKNGSEVTIGGTKISNLTDEDFFGIYYTPEKIYHIQGDYIYYNLPDTNIINNFKLYRIKSDGTQLHTGGTIVINEPDSFPYLFDGNYLCYQKNNEYSSQLIRLNKDGTNPLTIVDGGYDGGGIGQYIIHDNEYIYYQTYDYSNHSEGISRVKKDGTDVIIDYGQEFHVGTKIINNVSPSSTHFYSYSYEASKIVSDINNIYYTDRSSRKIYKFEKNGLDLSTGPALVSSLINSEILFLEGDYIYYRGVFNNTIYRIKTDGSEGLNGTKLSDLDFVVPMSRINYIYNDLNNIYYSHLINYNHDGNTSNTYIKLFKVKKDTTDSNFYIYTRGVASRYTNSLTFSGGAETKIKINVDATLPVGTDYELYLSKFGNDWNYLKIDNSSLDGSINIDLESLFGGAVTTLYYRLELLGDENDQTKTPVINYIEFFKGDVLVPINEAPSITGSLTSIQSSITSYNQLAFPLSISGINDSDSGQDLTFSFSVDGINYTNLLSTLATPLQNGNFSFNLNLSFVDDGDVIIYLKTNDGEVDSNIVSLSLNKDTTVIDLPEPTNLKQYINRPEFDESKKTVEVNKQEKIGKYQSGSGIILTAMINNIDNYNIKLEFEVFNRGELIPIHSLNTDFTNIDTLTGVTVPYSGTGGYYWRVKSVDEKGNSSDWSHYSYSDPNEVDFALYEGFEPYPYGYKFHNRRPISDILTGGNYVYIDNVFPYYHINYLPGTKWNIFNRAFDTSQGSGFEVGSSKALAAFDLLGLNNDDAFQDGNCFGMALSAAMKQKYPNYIKLNYLGFYNTIGIGKIWNLESPGTSPDVYWNIYNDTLEAILAFQLVQFTALEIDEKITGTSKILKELNENPNGTYLLLIEGSYSLLQPWKHAVVPYKVEGNKIYIWDNNEPYSTTNSSNAYDKFITIKSDGKWDTNIVSLPNYNKLTLVNIEFYYNGGNKRTPIGLNNTDSVYSISGYSDLIVEDSLGRLSGFSGGTILEEIPGIQLLVPFNATGTGITENKLKKIYLQEKQDLTLKIISKNIEKYDLMIAGGDYYTKISNVETSGGQIDTFNITRENIQIDFDDDKTGSYNLLVNNFYNNGTGTVYMDSVTSIPNPQQYTISWTGVVNNSTDSVIYEIDTDNDGNYDTTINLPPIYQDIIAPTTTVSLSGTITPNTNSGITSYIETTTITLNSIDNINGSGIKNIYYRLDNSTGAIYEIYTTPIQINGVGEYTISYYSVDNFGNEEEIKIQDFILTELPETHAGNISGYIYSDENENGIKDVGEKTMAGWKVFIDQNGDNELEHQSEPFQVTNNDGYYEFNSLITGTYHIQEIPHQNWIITNPVDGYYDINLGNGQVVIDKNFGNIKIK